jgi:hypothetical protein
VNQIKSAISPNSLLRFNVYPNQKIPPIKNGQTRLDAFSISQSVVWPSRVEKEIKMGIKATKNNSYPKNKPNVELKNPNRAERNVPNHKHKIQVGIQSGWSKREHK